MRIKKIVACGAIAVAAVVVGGCGKQIEASAVGATQVPGTTSLFRFCDGPTLIYYSNYDSGPDEVEFIVYEGCLPQGQPPKTQEVPEAN